MRFCLQSYSASGDLDKNSNKEFFYYKLIDYNSKEDITNIINNNYLPGRLG